MPSVATRRSGQWLDHPAEEPRFYLLAPIVAGPPGLGCIEMYGQVGWLLYVKEIFYAAHYTDR
jgi:hypothetical protein